MASFYYKFNVQGLAVLSYGIVVRFPEQEDGTRHEDGEAVGKQLWKIDQDVEFDYWPTNDEVLLAIKSPHPDFLIGDKRGLKINYIGRRFIQRKEMPDEDIKKS